MEHLNLFRHYGDRRYHEDNVTRALWIVLARTDHRDEMTRRFLAFLAGQKGVSEDLANALRSLSWDEAISYMLQVPSQRFSGFEDDRHTHRVVVGIAPDVDNPGEAEALPGGARPDATLSTDKLILLLENKIYRRLDEGQISRHAKECFGGKPHETIRVAWQDVVKFFQGLPEHLTRHLIVREFLEYLIELPQLMPGFSGLTPDDLKKPSWKTAIRLSKLAEVVVQRLRTIVKDYYPLAGGLDLDVYTREQLDMVGNLGFACWGGGDFSLKIACGNTTVQKEGVFDAQPTFAGRAGIDRVLRQCADDGYVGRVRRALEKVPEARVAVIARLKRAQREEWPHVREFEAKTLASDPRPLFTELASLHPANCGPAKPVTRETLELIKRRNLDFDLEKHVLPDGAKSKSGFLQYGALLITVSVDALRVGQMQDCEEQIQWTTMNLERLHELLLALSS
jgi:hypothetical protein